MTQIFLSVLSIYLSLGFVFAVLFALSGYKRIDTHAATAPLRIRILWMPAAVALWPLLARIWARSANNEPQAGDVQR